MSLIETKIYTRDNIALAAQQLRDGELIAFPTETVFGLGAIATNEEAVKKVFQVKGRPQDNPLIVHVANADQVKEYVTKISDIEDRLMEEFWPGPLTIVFPKKPNLLAPSVTPDKDTVAMRMPNHPEALSLIEATGIPLVGPSANTSGKPSPTRSEHVYHDFNGKIAGILEPQEKILAVGVESTVVFVQDHIVKILRPGMVTKEMIEAMGLEVEELNAETQLANPSLLSPGVKYTHYSPKQSVSVLISQDPQRYLEMIELDKRPVAILADEKIVAQLKSHPKVVATYSYGKKGDLVSATQTLYAGLRDLEQSKAEWILAQGFKESDQSHALMNRLTKAADKVVN